MRVGRAALLALPILSSTLAPAIVPNPWNILWVIDNSASMQDDISREKEKTSGSVPSGSVAERGTTLANGRKPPPLQLKRRMVFDCSH